MAVNVLRTGFRNVIRATSLFVKPQSSRFISSLLPNHVASSCVLAQSNKFTPPLHNNVASICSVVNSLPNNTILSRLNELSVVSNQCEQKRTVIKFGLNKGGYKTVKAVVSRFYRLQSGLWIRPRAGRSMRKYRKSTIRNRRLSQHVICNKQQCEMLDKMVAKFWRRPKFYVDNIYEPYERRVNFMHGRRLGPNYQF